MKIVHKFAQKQSHPITHIFTKLYANPIRNEKSCFLTHRQNVVKTRAFPTPLTELLLPCVCCPEEVTVGSKHLCHPPYTHLHAGTQAHSTIRVSFLTNIILSPW